MIRVIGVGDNTVDKYLHIRLMFPGGNAVNVSVLAHRYGHKASYIGWLGDDVAGRLVLAALQEEGVDTSRCRVFPGPNATSEVTSVEGERVFGRSNPGVSRHIALDEADFAFIGRHDVTHSSIYSHLGNQLSSLSRASNRLSFDFSDLRDWAYLKTALPLIDIAFLSSPAGKPSQTVDLARWAQAQGPSVVVATQGKEGALAYDGKALVRQAIMPTTVLDTLGAGDAFAARFLVEHLSGASLEQAMAAAAMSAAETCTYLGAFGHGVPF